MKDYYAILGIPPDATTEEVRAAFREQAKRLHPDYYRGDSQPFREAQEAWNTLGDAARRRAYDRQRPTARREALVPRERPRRPDPSARRPPIVPTDTSRRSESPPLEISVRLSPRLAAQGGRVTVPMRLRMLCPQCEGVAPLFWLGCSGCGGSGWVTAAAEAHLRLPAALQPGDDVNYTLAFQDGRQVRLRLRVV